VQIPKAQKSLTVFFSLLQSAHVKGARKLVDEIDTLTESSVELLTKASPEQPMAVARRSPYKPALLSQWQKLEMNDPD